MENKKEYWESRWQNQQTGWDIGYASPALIDYFKQVEHKEVSILIPGCGNAYEAVALWDLGFRNLTLVDISATAVSQIQSRLQDKTGIKILHEDFFLLQEQFDYIVEQTFFCALTPELRLSYVKKMRELLKPGGFLIGLLFDRDFEQGPPFGGNQTEYQSLFSPYFKILKMEKAYNSIPERAGTELFIEFTRPI